jgi:hypothetical protein
MRPLPGHCGPRRWPEQNEAGCGCRRLIPGEVGLRRGREPPAAGRLAGLDEELLAATWREDDQEMRLGRVDGERVRCAAADGPRCTGADLVVDSKPLSAHICTIGGRSSADNPTRTRFRWDFPVRSYGAVTAAV